MAGTQSQKWRNSDDESEEEDMSSSSGMADSSDLSESDDGTGFEPILHPLLATTSRRNAAAEEEEEEDEEEDSDDDKDSSSEEEEEAVGTPEDMEYPDKMQNPSEDEEEVGGNKAGSSSTKRAKNALPSPSRKRKGDFPTNTVIAKRRVEEDPGDTYPSSEDADLPASQSQAIPAADDPEPEEYEAEEDAAEDDE